MNIAQSLTKKQFKEILVYISEKSKETENLEVKELINEIKYQIISAVNSSKNKQ